MRSDLLVAAGTVAVLVSAAAAEAATLAVPYSHPTISSAFAASRPGDTITLEPGVYREFGLVAPAGVTLVGLGSGPEAVVLDGEGKGRILVVEGVVDTFEVRNVTFANGRAFGPTSYEQSGGAILVTNSQAVVNGCVFSGNTAEAHGGAIRCVGSSPPISGSRFEGNAAGGGGGAIDASYGSDPTISACRFEGNIADWGGALACRGGSSPLVETGEFFDNTAAGVRGFGGAVFADTRSEPDLIHCTIADGKARFGGALASFSGGAVNLAYSTVAANDADVLEGGMLVIDSLPIITGSILAFNRGFGISYSGSEPPPITCTNIFGNSTGDWSPSLKDVLNSGGNRSLDPGFCSVEPDSEVRFHLRQDSGLDLSGDVCGTLGALPVSCGVTEVPADAPPASRGLSEVAAWPNPFNPRTSVGFTLDVERKVTVSVYGLDGRLVRILADGIFSVGQHGVVWDGQDQAGRPSASGTYFVIVRGGGQTNRLKVTLLK